jgi:hypothetical protein
MDIGERDIGERDIGESASRESNISERNIGEPVATCRFNQQLLIHIHIQGVSGCVSSSLRWHRWARFVQRQKHLMLQPSEG